MDFVIKRSKIDKKGVFANKEFKKGEIVLNWNPKKLSESEVKELPEREKHCLFYDKGVAYIIQPPGSYVNHSCEANTKPMKLKDIATRDIKRGEEITSDYGKDSSVSFVCKCGSDKCIGVINSNKLAVLR